MGPQLLTAEHFYSHPRGNWHKQPVSTWAWHKHPIPDWKRRMLGELPRLGQTDAKAVTYAYVNHGRWLADCPFCASCQVVSVSDPRFLCTGEGGCGNVQVGGAFATVVWPKEHAKIEAELVKRAVPETRNWKPGETVKGLRAENVERGATT